jgi:mannosyltransferase OCH1-like enzyme
VEQKNSTLVRAYVGYDRLDTRAQCATLNDLYDQLWLYYNLFQPVMHMIEKEVVDGKLHRKHDKAKTPYQRLLASNILLPEQKTRLAALYDKTNPRELHRKIYQTVEQLWQNKVSNNSNRKEAALLR